MYRKYGKRTLDLIISVIALPFFFLIFIIISPLIFFSDKGSFFYNADRLGKDGKVFKMYKFRSMKMNVPDLRNEDGSTFNAEDDPRLTAIGKFIRKTSIDETPQLFNVLNGKMSIVGPRPDLPEHIKQYENNEIRKLEVLPGVTGYSQAYFRNTIEWKQRIQNDIYYVDNMSLNLDIKIIFRTIISVFKHDGVFIDCIEQKEEEQNGTQQILKIESQSNNYIYRELQWDSDHFGVSCARLDLNGAISDAEKYFLQQWLSKYEFVCVSNSRECFDNNIWIAEATNAFLTDVNVQFELTVNSFAVGLTKDISISNYMVYNQQIIDIAKESFNFSRFLNDKHISSEQAVGVYSSWVKNAFHRDDKYFSIYSSDEKILGFILYSIDDSNLTIELIACTKNEQRIGIGSQLLGSVKNFALANGIHMIKVGTQVANIKAVNFYTKNQFKLCDVRYIYHLWNS